MKRTVAAVCLLSVLGACGEETPPHTVLQFIEDPILLEATMVRCGQDRAASRYEAECINARDAVDYLAAAREQARREELEAESERKREALRRAQQAAADARRRLQEAREREEEAAYYGVFEPLPPEDDASERAETDDRTPPGEQPANDDDHPLQDIEGAALPYSGGAGPRPPDDAERGTAATEDEFNGSGGTAEPGTELDSVRDELKRRQDQGQTEDSNQ